MTMPSVKDYLMRKQMAKFDPGGVSEEDDETVPYSGIARAGAPDPDISRGAVASPAPMSTSGDPAYSDDPMMKRFDQDQDLQAKYLQYKTGSDAENNIAQAFSQAALGTQAPKGNDALYKTMGDQNSEMNKTLGAQVGAREKVIEAIQKRKAAEAQNSILNQIKIQDAGRKESQVDAYNKRTDALQGNAKSRLDNANVRTAGSLFKDPNLSREVNKLNSAKSAQTLIDEIRAGHLTDSSNVKSQLTNLLTQIELGAPGGQGDRHNMGVDTLYGNIQKTMSYIEGKPNSTIPKEYLDQIESEAHALGNRAAKNYKSLTDSTIEGADLSKGDPDADPGQVLQLAKQRQAKFLKSSGYDPETGEKIGASKSQTVMMKGPDGKVRAIPVAQKDAALAAGGTLVQ